MCEQIFDIYNEYNTNKDISKCNKSYPILSVWSLVYTIIINIFITLNHIFKTVGPWTNIRKIPNATCVLTGGSRGLGKSILQQLMNRFPNLKIIIVDIEHPDIKNDHIQFYRTDLSEPKEVSTVLTKIKREYDQIDMLINCAGVRSRYQEFFSTTSAEIHKIFQVNVFAPIAFIRELAPQNSAHQFYLVTIGSALGIVAPAKISSYAATKSALISFHESWTFELLSKGVQNIRTLLVIPGQLNTSMFDGFQPPRPFFAPIVDCEKLAKQVIESCEAGIRGQLRAPAYVHFIHFLSKMPYIIIYLARYLSKMDICLPTETVSNVAK